MDEVRVREGRGFWGEWPTLALVALCYGGFVWAATSLATLSIPLACVACTLCVALHSSLSHLAHHEDSRLTDAYDDPESNFMDPAVWAQLSRPMRAVMRFNNTLAGRLLIGPALGQVAFMRTDWQLIRGGDRRVLISWLWHLPAAALPVWWIAYTGTFPLWAYFAAVYAGLAILKIRTFLDAHDEARGRTVIIEDRGPLALLFLNNNYHAVHHIHPQVSWFDLPALFRAGRARYLQINDGYFYRSYAEIFRPHFFKPKDPVPHPMMHEPRS